MTRVLLAMFLAPTLALAAEKGEAPPEDPMAGWVPPKVTNAAKDRKEIQALFQAMDAASKRGDVEAAAALVDFPVLMATDDSKGEGMAETWSREEWIEVMAPFYAKPMSDVTVKHKPNVFLLSDSLASVHDVVTVTAGPKTMTMRNTTLLVRRDGKWRVKAMAEGGWGDMMASKETAASGSAASEGTGSGAPEAPASESPWGGAPEPPAAEPPQGTAK